LGGSYEIKKGRRIEHGIKRKKIRKRKKESAGEVVEIF
jgi:hypothetical protein